MIETMKLAVIGATSAGIGAAVNADENAVIFEKGMLLGSEFGASLHSGVWQGGKEDGMFRRLMTCGAVSEDGVLHYPGLAPQLALIVKEHRKTVGLKLFTRVTDVFPCEDGFRLTYLDAEGFHSGFAEHVIVTAHDGQPCCERNTHRRKLLCAQLSSDGDEEIRGRRTENWFIESGAVARERIFCVPVDECPDMQSAREKLHTLWMSASRKELAGWALAAVSLKFAYEYDRPICEKLENGAVYLPSASFGNPIGAFNGGAKCVTAIF